MVYQKEIRENNEKKIFSYLYYKEVFSVVEIVENFNVTFPTAKSILEKFLEKDIVRALEKEKGKAGRRAQLYAINPSSVYSIGIKVELDKIVIILIDLKGKVIKKFNYSEYLVENEDIVESLVVKLKDFICDLDEESLEKVIGVGLSIPGIIDKKNKVLKIGTNFRIKDKSLAEIGEAINRSLYVENEANAGAVAEKILGEAVGTENFNFLSVGTGIGLGTYNMGILYKGYSNMAGEIGHMNIDKQGKKCNCGGSGCWELYASDVAFLEMIREVYPEINNFQDIFKDKYKDTSKGREVIQRYIGYLAVGIRSLLMISNPEKIIIGGGIVRYREYIEKPLKENIFNENIFYSNKDIIKFSKFNENGNLIGAALLPIIEEFF